MEQKANEFVAKVDVGCPTMEAVTNHLVGTVDVTPLNFGCRCWRLNTKINSMLTNHVLCDVDVRDLVGLMEELGVRNQWKEMNAKIRAELEGISAHVEEATKVLDANPPEYTFRRLACSHVMVGEPVAFIPEVVVVVPEVVEVVPEVVEEVVPEVVEVVVEEPELVFIAEPCIFVPETSVFVEAPEPCILALGELTLNEPAQPIECSLAELPWQQWHNRMNNEVASVQVEEIIPVKDQQVERRLFGEWDMLMEDVLEWHRRGLHRFHVRMCMCQHEVVNAHCHGQ